MKIINRMYPKFNIKSYIAELFRPWKFVTFSLALGFYIWGAYFYRLPTWDVPVSIIMSLLTYFFSPWVVKTLFYLYCERPKKWKLKLFVCLLVTYACALGSYEIYHMTIGIGCHPPTYWPNLYYSTLIFLAAGIFWKFEGTFAQLFKLVREETISKYKKRPFMFVTFWIILLCIFFISFYKSLMLDKF